jgi:hypothetical protein
MKISWALLFLPLAVAMPALRGLGGIEITIELNGHEVSVTDDNDYYSCLVKTYPPDYNDCPAGYVSQSDLTAGFENTDMLCRTPFLLVKAYDS